MKRLLGIVAALVGVAIVGAGLATWLRLREARQAGGPWALSGLTVEEAAGRFPKTVTSPAALAIAAAAVRMGRPPGGGGLVRHG